MAVLFKNVFSSYLLVHKWQNSLICAHWQTNVKTTFMRKSSGPKQHTPKCGFLSLSSSQRFAWPLLFTLHETFFCHDVIRSNRPLCVCVCGDRVCLRCSFICWSIRRACDESMFRVSHAFMSQHALRLTYISGKSNKQAKSLTWLERFYFNPVSGQLTLYTKHLPVCVFVFQSH